MRLQMVQLVQEGDLVGESQESAFLQEKAAEIAMRIKPSESYVYRHRTACATIVCDDKQIKFEFE
eukprot:3936963-Rhodomonas_salina.2